MPAMRWPWRPNCAVSPPNREAEHYAAVLAEADGEISRLSTLWASKGKPDLWFCYHPYYKAPDLIGPTLASAFAIPYVTAEASYSSRRNVGVWAETQASVAETVKIAALNICFTHRDRDGLAKIAPDATFAMLPPFIDTSAFAASPHSGSSGLIAVAMMRPGDKLDSYRMLARALERLPDAALDACDRRRWALPRGGRSGIRRACRPVASNGSARRSPTRFRKLLRRAASMSGRVAAKLMDWPISRPRRPVCPSWRRTQPACRKSCAQAKREF